MELSAKKGSLFIIDRQNKANRSLKDLEYDIKTFAEEYNGKLIILDMLKDIDFGVQYDINNYQDVAQQIFSKLRTYCDKYNVTFLVTHPLNKTGKTLGSIALDATVDGRITFFPVSIIFSIIKYHLTTKKTPIQKLIKYKPVLVLPFYIYYYIIKSYYFYY